MLATILWGVWAFAQKSAVARAHPFTVQWMYALPYLVLIPVWVYLSRQEAPGVPFDPVAFGWAFGAGVAAVSALGLFMIALRTTDSSLAAAVTGAYPVVTLILASLAGQETFTLQKLAGIAVVVIGITILSR
ncbi:MAG: EamA family transporter [Anaerolineae bacterium]